ncbi:hypothetical protein ACP4OV_006710 [Aristida adscensionis]
MKERLEFEVKHLAEKLQVMEFKQSDEAPEFRKRIDEEKINELKDVGDYNESLIIKESKNSNELYEARAAKYAWCCYRGADEDRHQEVGELDPKSFQSTCKRKFREEDIEVESATLCPKWQNEINNLEWRPSKAVMADGKESEVLKKTTISFEN